MLMTGKPANLLLIGIVGLVCWSISGLGHAQTAQPLAKIDLPDLAIPALDISGIVVTEDFIALASDEGHALQLIQRQPANSTNPLLAGNAYPAFPLTRSQDELDLEGLAWQAPYLYAIGSHSLKRKKLKDNLSETKNLKRLADVVEEPSRHHVFRLRLDAQQNVLEVTSLSLDDILQKEEILKPFIQIPSKENGIDIEGLSITPKGELLVGFRGPVIRGNLAALLRIQLKKKTFAIKSSEIHWLNLNGRGIRGISQIANTDDWLILAGDVGDLQTAYEIYRWDGKTHFDAQTPLCQLPTTQGKPEGIQWMGKQGNQWRFVIVQDGLAKGEPQIFGCQGNR